MLEFKAGSGDRLHSFLWDLSLFSRVNQLDEAHSYLLEFLNINHI